MGKIIENTCIHQWDHPIDSETQQQLTHSLESGSVLWFPHLPFQIIQNESALFSSDIPLRSSKNIGYHPLSKKMRGVKVNDDIEQLLKTMMGRFAEYAHQLILNLFPTYSTALEWGRTSFRPVEIKGRIPKSYRKDDTRLHVDAFPASPNQGRRILRVFCNVNPDGLPRVWKLGAPFKEVVSDFLPKVPRAMMGSRQLMQWFKLTRGPRTLYDHIMLNIHNLMKADLHYQKNVSQLQFDFPAGSTWIVFTDYVSHAALSGQYMLEQTFYLPVESMMYPHLSPVKILESTLAKKLV